MLAILRWSIIVASLLWMAVICLGTAKSSDPLWALTAFRSVVPADGVLLLCTYLTCSFALPIVGLSCFVGKIARGDPSRLMIGGIVGACVGVFLDYLQFAMPFAGDIVNVPGLPAVLMFHGDGRLAEIWAVSFCANVAVFGTLGLVLGWALGRPRSTVGQDDSTDGRIAQQLDVERTIKRVAGGVTVCVLLLVVALWRFGPGTAGVGALLAQFDAASGVRYSRDIVFGRADGVELKLDLCKPARSTDRLPAVVCIHGGGWRGGKRSEYVPLIVQLAQRDYVAVTIDYRLAPAHHFPAQAEDVRSAIRWIRKHADEFGVDPEHIGLVGWSAGGHLACFVGVTGTPVVSRSGESIATTELGDLSLSANVQAVVSFSGLSDLTADYWNELSSGRRALVGGGSGDNAAAYRSASPLAYVDRDEPPFFLVHGAADAVVPLDQSQRLRDRLQAADGAASLLEVVGQGHRWFGSALRSANRDIFAFLDLYLKGGSGAKASGATHDGSG